MEYFDYTVLNDMRESIMLLESRYRDSPGYCKRLLETFRQLENYFHKSNSNIAQLKESLKLAVDRENLYKTKYAELRAKNKSLIQSYEGKINQIASYYSNGENWCPTSTLKEENKELLFLLNDKQRKHKKHIEDWKHKYGKLTEQTDRYRNQLETAKRDLRLALEEREQVYSQLEGISIDLETREKNIKNSKEKHKEQIRNLETQLFSTQQNADEIQKMLEDTLHTLEKKNSQWQTLVHAQDSDKKYKEILAKLQETKAQLKYTEKELKKQQGILESTASTHLELSPEDPKLQEEQSEVFLWKRALFEIAAFQIPNSRKALKSIIKIPKTPPTVKPSTQSETCAVTQQIKEILPSISLLTQQYQNELAERRKLHCLLQDLRGNLRVMCRVRPLLSLESSSECVFITDSCQLQLSNSATKRDSFYEFSRVFAPTDSQETVYYEASSIINSVMNGYNGCILAYGQTGSGKTFTMQGESSAQGITTRSLTEIFEIIQSREESYIYSIAISIVEVYNDNLYDLIAPSDKKITIREDNKGNTQLLDLAVTLVDSLEEILSIVELAGKNRSTESTSANECSSRSHSILTLYVNATTSTGTEFSCKLHLVDLAGSERLQKSQAIGPRLQETCSINSSLSTLAKVLHQLTVKEKYVSYRDSKLTHVLKDSLVGDARTLIIVTVSPCDWDINETASSLGFGSRVANIEKGRPKMNVKGVKNGSLNEYESSLGFY